MFGARWAELRRIVREHSSVDDREVVAADAVRHVGFGWEVLVAHSPETLERRGGSVVRIVDQHVAGPPIAIDADGFVCGEGSLPDRSLIQVAVVVIDAGPLPPKLDVADRLHQ